MLETEKQIKARYDLEVTADYPSVRAEHRAQAFEEVLRLFDPGEAAAVDKT